MVFDNDLGQELEKKLNGVKSSYNSTINIKEMITFFKDENQKWKKNSKICKTPI